MPLWLDMLRTPMAAPETHALRRMRRIWQGLCLLMAAFIAFIRVWPRATGRVGPAAAAALILGTLAYTALYVIRKQRADRAFVDEIGRPP